MSTKSSFHNNVFLLTQSVPPSKEFQKYFKEGMFDKPNTHGFIHVSHYLLTIYNEERFKRVIEWPLLDKRSEAKYRNDVKEFLTIVINENDDIECPPVLTSYLLTCSGTKFVTLMWKLSLIVLRAYLKREVGPVLGAPKPGNAEPLTKLFFNNEIALHESRIKEIDVRMKKTENLAKEFVKERLDSIKLVQSELFESRKRLVETVEKLDVHSDTKKRLANTNDNEVIELWKQNIQSGIDYLKEQVSCVEDIEKKSTIVNNLVMNLFSADRKTLDGRNLIKLNTQKLMELPFEPEAQVAIHHLYEDDKLVLNNFFILLNSALRYLYSDLKQNGLPDLSQCKLQIQASTEDLEKMGSIIDQTQNRLMQMSYELQNKPPLNQHNDHPDIFLNQDHESLDITLLKASPKIQFNMVNNNTERNDIQERLKLTPVEVQHRSLFPRFKSNNNNEDSITPARPKLTVSRINFTDALQQSPSNISLGAIPKRNISTKLDNKSTHEKHVTKKFARLFESRPGIFSSGNSSATSTSSWKASTFIEGHNGGGNIIYNMSDIRAQLATTNSTNVSLDLPTPIKFSTHCTNPPPNTLPIKHIEKPDFNSTEVISDLQTINETTEIDIGTTAMCQTTNEVGKQNNRRLSISDLVERYKKRREELDSKKLVQSELFESRKQLVETVEKLDVHSDAKKRLANTNDNEVIELWKQNIQSVIDYLKEQVSCVEDIEKKSAIVNNLVMNLFSADRKTLDGRNLIKLNTQKLILLNKLF